jgi:ATPase subunit of ABC transporter with duplicated ATPase domains
MSASLTLDRLSLAAPDGRVLFSGLTLALSGERLGLVGRNGSGKSTLLRAILGKVDPSSGFLAVTGRVALLRQAPSLDHPDAAGLLGVREALATLARLEQGEGREEDAAAADWLLPSRIEEVLAGLGLAGLDLERPVASLSGGERTRLGLAHLLLAAPDLLLLDEPTNNLDREGREAVAMLVRRWRGALVVASHDRALLEEVDRIAELSPIGVTQFGGGWSAFVRAREAARERAAQAVDRAQSALRETQREAQRRRERQDRRDAGGRVFAASGSAPRIGLGSAKRRAEETAGRGSTLSARQVERAREELEEMRRQVEITAPLRIELPRTDLPRARVVLAFDEVEFTCGTRHLFGPLSFAVQGPERLAVAGPNGAGKTSLLKIATGMTPPTVGRVRRAGRIAYLDQHVTLLRDDLSVLDNLRRCQPGLTGNAAQATLARFAFRNVDARRPAGGLSGGERLRTGLACAMSGPTPPELLLLDEPTNHLDLASVEVLEAGLRDYDGALVVVSHDEAFLRAIGVERTIGLGARLTSPFDDRPGLVG